MFERKSTKQEMGNRTALAAEVSVSAPKPQVTSKGIKAMIGAKVKISGDIESSEDLLIEGEVNGTINLKDNELVVGNSGRLQADISAKTVRIEGEVQGDITGTERVIICASGNVQGNLTAPRVILEDGGRFKGSIDMGTAVKTNAAASKPVSQAVPTADTGPGKIERSA